MKVYALACSLLMATGGCQTYRYAQQVKMIAFHDDFHKAESVGNVSGKDCQSVILGVQTSTKPTLDRAFEKIQTKGGKEIRLKYLNDVSTEEDSFEGGVYAKRCLIVKGRGYK